SQSSRPIIPSSFRWRCCGKPTLVQATWPPCRRLSPTPTISRHGSNCSEVSSMEIKALVTDSSSEARKNITRSLQEIGVHNVVEATDGQQAVKLLETDKFDICFAEWNTQIGKGQELMKSFRRTNAKMPIVVTAPKSKQIDELKKTYPTASNYLTLPFTTE